MTLRELPTSKSKNEGGLLSTSQRGRKFRRHERLPLFHSPGLIFLIMAKTIAERCKDMTMFARKFGTFWFDFMSFWEMTAPATFRRLMNKIMKNKPIAPVNIDNIVISSTAFSDYNEFVIIIRNGFQKLNSA